MATQRRARAVSIGRDIGVALAVLQGLYLAIVQTPHAATASDSTKLATHAASLAALEQRIDKQERMHEAMASNLSRLASDVAGIQGELRRLTQKHEPEGPQFVTGSSGSSSTAEVRADGG